MIIELNQATEDVVFQDIAKEEVVVQDIDEEVVVAQDIDEEVVETEEHVVDDIDRKYKVILKVLWEE